jgi:Family of unknown function (DUF6251)
MSNEIAHHHHAGCGCYDNGLPVQRPVPLPDQQPQIVHQHIHAAAPDRTVARLALGSGVGAGAVAAGVFLGPLLIAALSTVAVTLAVTALAVAVTCWAVITVVRAVGGKGGSR